MQNYTIQDILEQDIEDILLLLSAESIAQYNTQTLQYMLHNTSYTLLKCTHNTEQHQNNIAGYIIWHTLFNNSDIISLYIHPLHRRQGLASLLLHNMYITLQALQQTSHDIFLEVSQENYNAIALYKKHLFETIHARKNYYTNGSDAIVMQKTI